METVQTVAKKMTNFVEEVDEEGIDVVDQVVDQGHYLVIVPLYGSKWFSLACSSVFLGRARSPPDC